MFVLRVIFFPARRGANELEYNEIKDLMKEINVRHFNIT
jgi:hypothetical protein